MSVRFGYRGLDFPSAELGELRESQSLVADPQALRKRLEEDGYLLIRGLIDRGKVMHARRTLLEYMDSQQALVPDTQVFDGVMPKDGRTVQMRGRKGIAHHPDVLNVLENVELFNLFGRLFGETAMTFHYKWLRAVGNAEYTGAHYDFVYMGRGSQNLHSAWIPLGDIPIEQGTLAICVGSHSLASFERLRQTYGKMDVDRDKIEGWFTRDPLEIVEKFGGSWQTTEYFAGDVILFGMHTMHASTTNTTNRYRLSSDVRYQPASEPADPRWVKGGTGPTNKDLVRAMEAARKEWNV